MGSIPPTGHPSRSRRASRDGADDGEDVEEDQEEAADGREEAEREGEEDATGGCSKENVVAEEEDFVGVVVGIAY